MADDGPQGTAHSLEMTAQLVSATLRLNPDTGSGTYRMVFIYPGGYDQYLQQISDGAADVYINGTLAGQSVKIPKTVFKARTKDKDAEYSVIFDFDPGDAVRFHIGTLAAQPAVILRLVSTQIAMFAN